jgi:hypothetical protein
LTLNSSEGAGADAGPFDPTVLLSVGVIATVLVSRLMPVIVPALSCCWADAEPQRAMAATVIMMLAVFIGLSLFRARGTRRRGRIWFRKTA